MVIEIVSAAVAVMSLALSFHGKYRASLMSRDMKHANKIREDINASERIENNRMEIKRLTFVIIKLIEYEEGIDRDWDRRSLRRHMLDSITGFGDNEYNEPVSRPRLSDPK